MAPTAFDERELTVLLSALLLVLASWYFGRELKRLPEWRTLLGALLCLLLGGTATIVEHFAYYGICNTIEHAAYFAQSALLLKWALRARGAPA